MEVSDSLFSHHDAIALVARVAEKMDPLDWTVPPDKLEERAFAAPDRRRQDR